MDWVQILQAFGYPITCAAALGWFVYKLVVRDKDEAKDREAKLQEDSKEREKALQESIKEGIAALARVSATIEESNKLNKELSETNRLLVDKMVEEVDGIKDKVGIIDTNVDKILNKLDQ